MANIKLSGNIVKTDPELRFFPDGVKSVCGFTVSLFTGKTPTGEYNKSVFVDVSAWNELGAEIAKTYHKGDRVTITGWVQPPSTWTTPEGVERPNNLRVKCTGIEPGNTFEQKAQEVDF